MIKKIIAIKPFNNKIFYKNAIFKKDSKTGSSYLIAARKLLIRNKIQISTIDLVDNSEKDVYMEVPFPWEIKLWLRIIRNKSKNILFIGEPSLINPFSFMKIIHSFFTRIYTWNDNLIDNKKYFKYFIPKTKEGINTSKIQFQKKKLLVLMNSNLAPFLPFRLLSLSKKEFYTERVRAIDFFNKYYPTDFSLYGRGWNKPQRFNLKQKLLGYKKYKTYKGKFSDKDKYKILSQFRFCLCIENCEDIGYISEKIVECFKGRCVPVYLGSPNIKSYINNKCFIDYRNFKNYQELALFLSSMTEETHNQYLMEIEKTLLSNNFWDRWSIEAFAKVFLNAIKD